MGCKTSGSKTTKDDHEEAAHWRPLLWCPNEACDEFEKPGGVHVKFRRRYGDESTQLLYKCTKCGGTFSLRRNTPLHGVRVPEEAFFLVVTCLGEGNGIRATARIAGLKKDTIMAIQDRVGRHAERVFNHHLREPSPREVQLDELWSFLKKKEKNTSEVEALRKEWGECRVWVAFDPESKVVLGFVLGKRTKDRAVRLLKRVHEVLAPGKFPLFTSDELSSYEDAIVEVFGVTIHPERNGDRGRFPKPRRVPHARLKYAVVHKHRENNRATRVEKRIVLGHPEKIQRVLEGSTASKTVNTSGVERENGKLRAGAGRLRRKTHGFAREKSMLRSGISLSLGYDHDCRGHKSLRRRKRGRPPTRAGLRRYDQRSPMMALGKTDHVWSARELVSHRVPGRNVRCFYGSG